MRLFELSRDKRFFFYFLVLAVLLGSFVCYAVVYSFSASDDFVVRIPEGRALAFQLAQHENIDNYPYVSLYADGSDMNFSSCDLFYGGDGGRFDFTCDNDVNVTVGFYPALVSPVLGNSGQFESGTVFELSNATSYSLIFSSYDLAIFNVNLDVGINMVIVVIVLFAPVIGLFLLGVGKWALPVGLTIGAILGYAFLPMMVTSFVFPEWVLFGIFMVDVVMFVAIWRGGG